MKNIIIEQINLTESEIANFDTTFTLKVINVPATEDYPEIKDLVVFFNTENPKSDFNILSLIEGKLVPVEIRKLINALAFISDETELYTTLKHVLSPDAIKQIDVELPKKKATIASKKYAREMHNKNLIINQFASFCTDDVSFLNAKKKIILQSSTVDAQMVDRGVFKAAQSNQPKIINFLLDFARKQNFILEHASASFNATTDLEIATAIDEYSGLSELSKQLHISEDFFNRAICAAGEEQTGSDITNQCSKYQEDIFVYTLDTEKKDALKYLFALDLGAAVLSMGFITAAKNNKLEVIKTYFEFSDVMKAVAINDVNTKQLSREMSDLIESYKLQQKLRKTLPSDKAPIVSKL